MSARPKWTHLPRYPGEERACGHRPAHSSDTDLSSRCTSRNAFLVLSVSEWSRALFLAIYQYPSHLDPEVGAVIPAYAPHLNGS